MLLRKGKIDMKKYRDETWDFQGANTKEYTHCFHPYPAMMIPQVTGKIIDKYGKGATLLFDPYCGSGTSLVEASIRGIDSIGTDINPLARLLSKTKTTIIPIDELDKALKGFNEFVFSIRLGGKRLKPEIPQFKNIDYWFKKETQIMLAIVKEYIESIESENIKNFFRVAFSETVREVSLTRNGEFKLYRMTEKQMSKFNPDVFSILLSKLLRNRDGMKEYIRLRKKDAIAKIYDFNTVEVIPENILPPESADIIVTSPPYGDSRTTVAYGQFSRLSNQWLFKDYLNMIDKISMGGQPEKKIIRFDFQPLDEVIEKIAILDKKRVYDVVSFYSDYERSINNVSKVVKKDGIVAYVVGNRRVKGLEIPTDEITKEFFERNGFVHIETIMRAIPNKRMPKRNSPSNVTGVTDTTMNYEYIVVLKKEKY